MTMPFYRRYAPVILLTALIAYPFVMTGAYWGTATNENVVTDWLPDHFEETKRLRWFIERFGTTEMLAISWEGCTLVDKRVDKLADALRKIKIPDTDIDLFREVFTGPETLETLTSEPFNLSRRQAFARMQGWLVSPKAETCVVVRLSRPGERHRHFAVDEIYRLAQSECGLMFDEIHLAGPSIDSVAIDRTSNKTIQLLNFLCWGVCLVVAGISFRSLRIGFMTFFVALFCQYLSVAIIYYTGTTMNSILMMVASLVFVLSMSACVHLVNYYRDAATHDGQDHAPGQAVQVGWFPCWLAAGTTSLGMASLMVSGIKPIYTFGKYSAIGVLVGLAFLMLVLPAWLSIWPVRRWTTSPLPPDSQDHKRPATDRWYLWAQFVMRFHAVIVIASIVLLVTAGYQMTKITTTVNLHDMFGPEERVIQDYDWMQERIGPMLPVDVVLHIPHSNKKARMLARLKLVEGVREEIGKIEHVGGTITAATFGPKIPKGGGVRKSMLRTLTNRALEDNRKKFENLKFIYQDELEELWRITVRVGAHTRIDYAEFLDNLEQHLIPVIAEEERKAKNIRNVRATVCGGVPLVNKAQKQLLKDLMLSFATAFGLVGLAMILVLRNVVGGLISMIPNIVPSVCIFGIMGWSETVVDIGAMMTASAALGIAVDDTLHFIIWFRRGLRQNQDRPTAILCAFRRCGTAMTQTSLICGFGLLVYSLSPFIPISRFGWLMFMMLFACLLSDLVILPALLAGPLGRFFELKKSRQDAVSTEV